MAEELLTETPPAGGTEDPKPAVGGEGSGNDSMLPGWTAGLSKEQKEALTAEKVKLPEKFTEFWANHTQLEATAKKAVVIPGKDASEAEWKTYRERMGIPDGPDGYAFEKTQLPEGMTWDTQLEQAFKQKAHELGIPKETANKMFNWYNQMNITDFNRSKQAEAAAVAEKQQQIANATAILRTEWGENYTSRLQAADSAFKNDKIIPPGLRKELMEKGLNNHPDMVRLMDLTARATASDSRLGLGTEAGEAPNNTGIDYGQSFAKRYK